MTERGAAREAAPDLLPWFVPPLFILTVLVSGCATEPTARSAADSVQVLGEARYAVGDIQGARELFREELALAEAAVDSSVMARSLTWLAQAAWRLGDYAETRHLGDQALRIKLERHDSANLFRSYNILGLLAWNEARPLDATEMFKQAGLAAQAAGDSTDLAKASLNQGLVETSLGNYEDARRGFEVARDAARLLGDPRIEGRALINLGMLSMEVGDALGAIEHLRAAGPPLAAAGDVVGEQVLLGHLGAAYSAAGDPGRAIRYLDSALALARANGLRQEEAINLEQLAAVQAETGNYRRALRLLSEAQGIDAELGLVDEQAINLRYEARFQAALGNPRLARDKVRRALAMHRTIGVRLEELSDLVLLAELAATVPDPEAATGYLAAASELADSLGSRSARLEVALGRARIADTEGRVVPVLESLAAVQPDLAHSGYETAWEAEALRARAYARAGRLDSAASAGRRAIGALERVRRSFGSEHLRSTYLRERDRTYVDLAQVLARLGLDSDALKTADAARERGLVEHMATVGASPGVGSAAVLVTEQEALLMRIRELGSRLDELDELESGRLAEDSVVSSQQNRLQAELERARSEYSARAARIEARQRPAFVSAGLPRLDVSALQARLNVDEVLIAYLVGDDHVLVFVVTSDTLHSIVQPIDRVMLASRVRVAHETLANGPSNLNREPLERLYELLIGPIQKSGLFDDHARLIIVPHAELTYVPYAALRDPETGSFLVESHEILHVPSAGSLALLRARAADTRAPVANGATVLAPFPERLPATVQEAEAVRAALGEAAVLLGAEATEARLRSSLETSAVVHAATHGILNDRNPLFSRIELWSAGSAEGEFASMDGSVEVHEVIGLHVVSRLVFLSGCETGLGSGWTTGFGRGDDYATLARAFLYAGASNVIATLWRVEDAAAAIFARHFYARYATDRSPVPLADSPVKALALAQRAMITSGEYSDPYYWAAYRINGRGDRVEPQELASLSVPCSSAQTPPAGSH